MAFFKVVYIYSTSEYGWTELFYDEAASLDSFATPNATELQRTVQWRGAGVKLLAKKVIEEGGLRRSKIFNLNAKPFFGNDAAGADVGGVSAKIRLNFAGGGGRILEARGIADDMIQPRADGASVPSPALQQFITSYVGWIAYAQNPFLGKRLQSIGANPWKDVVSLTASPANANWTQVTISAIGAPLAAGTEVYFRGVDPLILPWLRGVYRTVGPATTTTFNIPTLYREAADVTTLTNVQWRAALYDYPAITGGNFLRFGTRDTGRPFSQRRGRRRGLKIR